MKKFFLLLLLCITLRINANHWEPDPYQFQNNMTLVGVVTFNGIEQRSEYLEIGAFCGDECRGSVMAQYEEVFDKYYFYLMIYGNSNDDISFRCFDHRINMELEMIQDASLVFQSNAMIGGVLEPFDIAFNSYQYDITVDVLPDVAGYATGMGTYNKYDTCYIQITPYEGYVFDGLTENNDTLTHQPYYSFIVLSDRDFVAHLSEQIIYYQITTEVTPDENAGTISGEGEYMENQNCTIRVTTNPGYAFVAITENGQIVTTNDIYVFEVTSDHHFVAEFEILPNYYNITGEVDPVDGGIISGLGVYEENETCTLHVSTNPGYIYNGLKENGSIVTTDNTYTFEVTADRHFEAEFELLPNYFIISAGVEPSNAGVVSGTGVYQENETCTLTVTPNEGYDFVAIKEDGDVVSDEPQYSFTVTSNRYFTAEFALKEYVINLTSNPENGGTLSGAGTYEHGETVYAIAIPNPNYLFKKWTREDGVIVSTNPQYVFEANSSVNLIAHFEYWDAIPENTTSYISLYPNPANDFVVIDNDTEGQYDMTIFDTFGRIVYKTVVCPSKNIINLSDLNSGVYFVVIDKYGQYDKMILVKE